PGRQWYRGRAAIRSVFAWAWALSGHGRSRFVPTAANAQPALAHYLRDPEEPAWRAHAIWLLTLQDEGIAALTGFMDTRIFAAFGLPTLLPVESATPARVSIRR